MHEQDLPSKQIEVHVITLIEICNNIQLRCIIGTFLQEVSD